jgi:hypothetical protein
VSWSVVGTSWRLGKEERQAIGSRHADPHGEYAVLRGSFGLGVEGGQGGEQMNDGILMEAVVSMRGAA